RIFTPFEQVEGAADRRYGGTGLGLTIARQLAALLGGELRLHSQLHRGSTFTCYLPSERSPVAVAKSAPPAEKPVEDDRARLRPDESYLLVIEDDPVFARTLGDVIHRQGIKYVVSLDGQSGLRQARERKPSGIVLDVRLPDIDGWQIIEELHRNPRTASIPVHFVSAVDGAERGMAMGAVGYLTK